MWLFISGNILRVEHISWFAKDENLDLVSIAKQTEQITLNGTRKYTFDKTRLPKYEYFKWMDESSEEFEGFPIWYANGCVEDDDDLAESLTNQVNNVTTDILQCFTHSNSSSDVTDSGFVIVACDKHENVIWLPNIITPGTLPNNVLSWPYLHQYFWLHGRCQLLGYMNTSITEENPELSEFKSTVPVIEQSPFLIQLCCDQVSQINPLDLQKSTLGWGEVSSMELDLRTDMMRFELLFKL